MERLMDSNLSWYWSLLSSTPHCDIDKIPTPRENRLEAANSVWVGILGCHSPVPLAKPLWLGFLTGWRCRLLVPGLRSSLAVVVLAEPLECLCVLGVQSIKQTDVSYLGGKKKEDIPPKLPYSLSRYLLEVRPSIAPVVFDSTDAGFKQRDPGKLPSW